jgi:hypothetical protein
LENRKQLFKRIRGSPVVTSSADESIPLSDRLGDGNYRECELSKLFESKYTDRMPVSQRPVNKRVPTDRHRNSPV